MKQFTLPKSERLYLREAIGQLFAKGKGFMVFPYRVVYRILPEEDPQEVRVAIMTVAPKKKFKHAVDRNRVKRLTREAYRINKVELHDFLASKNLKLQVAFIYADNHFLTFDETQRRIQQAIKNITSKVLRHNLNTTSPSTTSDPS